MCKLKTLVSIVVLFGVFLSGNAFAQASNWLAAPVPDVASFSSTNGSTISLDNHSAGVQNSNNRWNLQNPDSQTLRIEIRQTDHWISGSWNDWSGCGSGGECANRSEIAINPQYPAGTTLNYSFELMVEPGPVNTASWLLFHQIHTDDAGAGGCCAFQIGTAWEGGDHMAIYRRYMLAGQTTYTQVVAYQDPNPIQRGHYYSFNVSVRLRNDNTGYLNVWRDGVQIVNYQGPMGVCTSCHYYLKEGIYRGITASGVLPPEAIAANYRNTVITAGRAANHKNQTTKIGNQ
jgi:hypothetical protein